MANFNISNPVYLKVGSGTVFETPIDIVTPHLPGVPNTGITFGKNCYIEKFTKICSPPGFQITAGDNVIIGQLSTLGGNIFLGSHSALAPCTYISSANHMNKMKPTWLIKDQDRLVSRETWKIPTYIGEDAFVGYGTFVQYGIYIGRGAVIGPNSLVVKDVPPYSMQIGTPCREFDKRLAFEPKAEMRATEEEHRPYFYEGFFQQQQLIQTSLQEGILFAKEKAVLVLPGAQVNRLVISGKLRRGVNELVLRVESGGTLLGDCKLNSEHFECCFSELPAIESAVLPMQKYRQITLRVLDSTVDAGVYFQEESLYGIHSVKVS